MLKWFLAVLLLFLAVAGLYWWLYWPQRQALEAANRELAAERQTVSELRVRVEDLEAVRGRLDQTSAELRQKVAQTEKELDSLRSTQDALVGQLRQEIADHQVKVERVRDQIRVDMVDEILFDSGEAVLKPEGVAVLTKVGGVLTRVADRRIEIHGHTDNVPIVGALSRRFPTNWELSAARATNVARFLQDVAKVDPGRLTATANSEFHPRASNDDDKGRRLNRRIEILLAPVLPQGTVASASASAQ